MAKYSTEFKMRIVKEYLKGNISFKNLAKKYNISHHEIVKRWVMDFRKKGIEGLKSKKRGRPSKMSKTPKKSKDTKVETSTKISNSENE
ncbi:transposase [Anaerococcus hydrogenalis DSM 7454]|uniref:Transposase n=1 Tax=Anaerococcus hydrogenalis DSM 7454 TaxID=561177 RepID=B6W6Y2_9FIRM|nr:helix-turn-helix domain-containing protein [Anaerococcus hydrogenalis]EEB36835.1 transposase [Anaerococcus hydrogenalis DSM 7454]